MKKLIIFLLLFVCASQNAFSQKRIFLFEKFVHAKVKVKPRGVMTYIMNYDACTQKMCFMQGDEMMELTTLSVVDTISFGDRKFVVQDGGFREVYKGTNTTIYIDWLIRDVYQGAKGALGVTTQASVKALRLNDFADLGDSSASGYTSYDEQSPYKNDIYKRKCENTYYLTIDGKQVKVSKPKHLEKLFPEKAEQIKSYAKEKKIDFKDAASALDLIDYSVRL